jgi:hypothetical protein
MNFNWAMKHGMALCNEYYLRYNKVHFCHQGIHDMGNIDGDIYERFPNIAMTPFAQAMPDEYHNSNAVLAYRTYYKNDKVRFAKWEKGRKQPYWW